MNHVHIIGSPRSGTTLMLELMISGFHFTLVGKKELSLLHLPEDIPSNAIVCTKHPIDHKLLKHVIEIEKNTWFISMLRDPRDVVVSNHGQRPEIYWANLRQWKNWFNNSRAFENHPRLIEVRYEELVNAPDKIQKQIASRLPFLAVKYRFSEYHTHAKPSKESLLAMRNLRPVSNASIGNWRNHLPRIAGQLSIHGSIAKELIELGYEKNEKWLEILEGVPVDTTPGRWPDIQTKEQKNRWQRQMDKDLQKYLDQKGLA